MESEDVYTKQQRIAHLAHVHPQLSFTSLAYHIDMEWLKEAYRRTEKNKASGIDEITVREYGDNLETNLVSLLERFKSGSYVAPPVRRAFIPKNEDSDTFTFLGFTHYWGKSRYGKWIVKRKTAKKKLRASIRKVFEHCRKERHTPLQEQWKKLSSKLKGHYAFYGITNNFRSLKLFKRAVERTWKFWLNRRSRNRDVIWERYKKILEKYPLPEPRIVHTYLAKS